MTRAFDCQVSVHFQGEVGLWTQSRLAGRPVTGRVVTRHGAQCDNIIKYLKFATPISSGENASRC